MSFQNEREPAENGFKVIESRRIDVRLPWDFGVVNCVMAVTAAVVNTLCHLDRDKQISGHQIMTMLEKREFDYIHFTSIAALPRLLELIESDLGYETRCRELLIHPDFGRHLFGTIKKEIKAGRLVRLSIHTAEYWLKGIRGYMNYVEDGLAGHAVLVSGYSVIDIGGRKESILEVCDPYDVTAKVISVRLSDLQAALSEGPSSFRLLLLVLPLIGVFSLSRD